MQLGRAAGRYAEAENEVERLREGIRRHMEARANDPDVRESDRRLWELLDEGAEETDRG